MKSPGEGGCSDNSDKVVWLSRSGVSVFRREDAAPRDHHKEVRIAYLGGVSFLIFEGVLWLLSALFGSFISIRLAIITLLVGGMFIPLGSQVIQTLMKRPKVSKENPLISLSTSVAFIIPLSYPVIAAAAIANINWFFPALAVVVGAHYPPYAYVYQMRLYMVLCCVLVAGGTLIGWLFQDNFSPAGYFVGVVLLIFAAIFISTVQREEQNRRS